MTNEELAKQIALGLINTGVEGGFDNVCSSTAGDYPCMGVSSWEGIDGRGDSLLSYIDGGQKFVGRSYSDIVESGEKQELKDLLSSDQGQAAQLLILSTDCLDNYLPALALVDGLVNPLCIIYAGIWMPTSTYVVRRFLQKRADEHDLNDLEVLRELFRDEYYIAAGVGEQYAEGYANRAENTFDYVSGLELE